jgi:peptide/nickel transport system substrate-binding protein
LVGIAGCGGDEPEPEDGSLDGDGGGDDDGDSDSQQLADPVFDATMNAIPSNQQFNPFNQSNPLHVDASRLVFGWMAQYFPESVEFRPLLADDWDFSAETVSVTLADDITWHNGDPIVADDLVIQHELTQFVEQPEDPTFGKARAVDQKTFELDVNKSASEEILKLNLFGEQLNAPAHVFQEYRESIQDGGQDLRQELAQLSVEEPFGSGPLKVTDVTDQTMTLVPHDGHPGGSELNFDEYVLHYVENDQQRARGIINDEYDGVKILPTEDRYMDQYPDYVEVFKVPVNAGNGLLINQDEEPFDDHRVRQALAHAIDHEQLAKIMDDAMLSMEPTYFSGMSQFYVDSWIPEDLSQSFINYYDVDTGRATSLLEDAGFTQEGGTWVTPAGETFSLELKTPNSRIDWMRSVAENLREFGIEAETLGLEGQVAYGDMADSNFTIGMWDWGSGFDPHPYFDLEGVWSSDGWWNGLCGIPDTVSVPPVGEPAESRTEFDVASKMSEAGAVGREEMEGLIQELAWAYNQSLPVIPCTEVVNNTMLTSDDWEFPDADAEIMRAQDPNVLLPHFGELKAKTE